MNTPDDRAGFLRGLAADDFCPPDPRASGADPRPGPADPLAAEVAAFVAEYWELPPTDRRSRWLDLSARCADDGLARRLLELSAGLAVEPAPHPDPACDELARLARELVLLPPRARAVRRAEWMAAGTEFAAWRAAAGRLRTRDEVTLALDPRLFDGLRPGGPVVSAVPAATTQELWAAHTGRPARRRHPERVLVAVLLVFLVELSIVIGMAMSNDPPRQYPDPGRFPPPPPRPLPAVSFTPEQVAAFREYDRNPRGTPPHGYAGYRLTGGGARRTGR